MTDAQIYSQGYRRYEGPRTGVTGAIRSLVKHSMRKSLGLGRSARHKIVPVFVILIAYVPAIAFIGVAALTKELNDFLDILPSYADYYGYITTSILFMAAFVTPEILCTDRRTGFLGVYLASPLNRISYLFGKGITALVMIFTVTLGPPLFLLIAFSLQNVGPDGFAGWIEIFIKILISAAVIGIPYVAVSLAVSAVTDRKNFATAAFLAIVFGSSILESLLTTEADLSKTLRLLNILALPVQLVYRIYDESAAWRVAANSTSSLWVAWFGWVLVSLAIVWVSYRRMLVRR